MGLVILCEECELLMQMQIVLSSDLNEIKNLFCTIVQYKERVMEFLSLP